MSIELSMYLGATKVDILLVHHSHLWNDFFNMINNDVLLLHNNNEPALVLTQKIKAGATEWREPIVIGAGTQFADYIFIKMEGEEAVLESLLARARKDNIFMLTANPYINEHPDLITYVSEKPITQKAITHCLSKNSNTTLCGLKAKGFDTRDGYLLNDSEKNMQFAIDLEVDAAESYPLVCCERWCPVCLEKFIALLKGAEDHHKKTIMI